MYIHTVYFWSREDLTAAESAQLAAGVASLVSLPTVRHGWAGTPAGSEGPVIDSTFSHGLSLAFDDRQGHDDYQVHPDHLEFVGACSPLWIRVQVYDFFG